MKKIWISLIALLILMASIAPSLAWFIRSVDFDYDPNGLRGSTAAAYFGGGDGSSAENAYIISSPVHLYNLAWLQYIGYFNKASSANNGLTQSYFRLEDNIDMTGFTLPPIGTAQYPFLGVFDGNCHVISGLTTANAATAFAQAQRPMTVEFEVNGLLSTYLPTAAPMEVGNVMGLFGVVGDYNGAASAVGQSADETAAITIKDFGMYHCTVTDSSTATIAGLVAGYVNATVSGVMVSDCTLGIVNTASAPSDAADIETANVSDFTLIGYCTDGNFVNEQSVTVYTPTTSAAEKVPGGSGGGTESNWGASIAIKDLYNALNKIESESGAFSGYAHSASKFQGATNENNCFVLDRVLSETGNVRTDTGSKEYFSLVYTYFVDPTAKHPAGGAKITSMSFEKVEDNSTVAVNTIKCGDEFFNLGFYENGMPKLELGAHAETATKWGFEGNGVEKHLFAISEDYKIYLNIQDGDIVFSSSGSTLWGFQAGTDSDDGGLYYINSGTTYFLKHNGEKWVLETATASGAAYYYIHFGDHYLTLGDQQDSLMQQGILFTKTTDRANASKWYIDYITEGSYGYYEIYTMVGNTKYKLMATWAPSVSQVCWMGNPTETALGWTMNNGAYMYTYGNYYLSCDSNGNWSAASAANSDVSVESVELGGAGGMWSSVANGTAVNITYRSVDDPILEFGVANQNDSTYIPLQMNENHEPTNLNTGYITSGFYEEIFGNPNFSDISDGASDVRVAGYYSHNISNHSVVKVWDGDSFESLSTLDDDTNTGVSALGLKKYLSVVDENGDTVKGSVDAYNTLLNVTGQSLYGLHFMNASININSLVTIPLAKINGETFENYQIPGNCIDFHLKQAGYINFFAGSYFPGTNCFFSLHHIQRDSDQNIIAIFEIEEIYGKSGVEGNYIYKYTNGEYSGTLDSSYTLLFATDCLTDPGVLNNQAVTTDKTDLRGDGFYFEIPVNAGEYALGSVKDKTGAYLLYLDIGAAPTNATVGDIFRTVTTEAFSESTHTYANGVAIVEGALYPTEDTFPTDQHVALQLADGYSGEISLGASADGIAVGGSNAADAILRAELGADVIDKTIAATVTKRVTLTYTDINDIMLASAVITKRGDGAPEVTSGSAVLSADGNTVTMTVSGRTVTYVIDWGVISTEQDDVLMGYRLTYGEEVYSQWEYVNGTTYRVAVFTLNDNTNVSGDNGLTLTAESGASASFADGVYTVTATAGA